MESSKVQRQDMYKSSTPPWKDAYRKRCLERLRSSREKIHNQHRKFDKSGDEANTDSASFVRHVMTEELQSFDIDSFAIDDLDAMLSLFDDIQKELKIEEEKMVNDYEEYKQSLVHEEVALSAAIEALSTDEVICPLCQRHALMLNKGVIFCPCGLRINTEQDCISLANVKQQLDEGLSLHSSACNKTPAFSVVDGLGITNLLITCQICDFMFVVV
ncbi:RPA-interacting protein B-like [Gigantopelta aegis]|uniref:RPA-interacting protein B-like n=1 Tax=Gigantopelta aegis TaxID=1735272 RepID=UPI001B88DEC0|nr:RPA-interacting protein B-like [Gigantopelta aegis]XP_041347675.1 RPA-interacting protein B-like [Gigantopelta aegis]XP_041347676.1 RPA-interacting protein B-like [Gigantopelta aegis]XP_041347677.1 RPA-interacting protein B-like [Gigantopelta aegis]